MATSRLTRSLLLLLASVTALEATRCWQFTWPGDVDISDMNTTTCEDHPKDQPCIQPFVISRNSTPPDLRKLEELCDEGGCPDDLWCDTKGGESCVQWIYWTTDATTNQQVMKNYSLFCSTAHQGDNTTGVFDTLVRDGCAKQDVGGLQLEVCFCYDATQCNAINSSWSSRSPAGLVVLLCAAAVLWLS